MSFSRKLRRTKQIARNLSAHDAADLAVDYDGAEDLTGAAQFVSRPTGRKPNKNGQKAAARVGKPIHQNHMR